MTSTSTVTTLNNSTFTSRIPVGIPFGLLRRSPKNMRTIHPSKSEDDRKMLATFRAKGMVQNIVVYPKDDIFEVPAGGRRFGCLEVLFKTGEITDETPIPCLKITEEEASEVSLIENIHRLAPHPADVFTAFTALVGEGKAVGDIAYSHGITAAQVERYLRLGKVHKKLFTLFKSDKLSMEQIMAFAATADTKLQLATFKAIGENCDARPSYIREQLLAGRQSEKSALSLFVTLDAYEKAGGAVERDLFKDTTMLCDVKLLTRLCDVKLANVANGIKGWKWVETSTEGTFLLHKYHRLPSVQLDVPKAMNSEQEKLEKRLSELEEISSDNWTEELEAEFDKLEDELSALQEKIENVCTSFKDEDKPFAGCIVTFNQQSGETEVYSGLLTDDDLKAFRKRDIGQSAPNANRDEASPKPAKAEISSKLSYDLGLYRRADIRAAVAKDKSLAIDLLHFQICSQILSKSTGRWVSILDVSIRSVSDESSIGDFKTTAAAIDLSKTRSKLDLGWLSCKGELQQFHAFRKLPTGKRSALVSFAASTSMSSGTLPPGKDKLADSLVDELEIDFSQNWRPTESNYFSRLTKPLLLSQGKKWFGAAWAKTHEGNTKKAIVERLQQVFHGNAKSLTDKEQEIRSSWMPSEIQK